MVERNTGCGLVQDQSEEMSRLLLADPEDSLGPFLDLEMLGASIEYHQRARRER
jgi:hypothetical protein